MNLRLVETLYNKIAKDISESDIYTAMIVLGILHNELAIQHTRDAKKIKELYDMMANAAIREALAIDCTQLQTKEDTPQKEQRKKARKASGHESNSS